MSNETKKKKKGKGSGGFLSLQTPCGKKTDIAHAQKYRFRFDSDLVRSRDAVITTGKANRFPPKMICKSACG